MRLTTPSFWYDRGRLAPLILSPLSCLYNAGRILHQLAANPFKSEIPVICCGNLVAGGSGKTPTALAVMQLARSVPTIKNPCFLTRGYGGALKGHFLVNRDSHSAKDVGDEALLLERHAPTIVSRNRKEGAAYAKKAGFDLIVMDDGLQNTTLRQDIRLVIIDGHSGFGNGMLLPAGPLREPVKSGLQKASAVIIIGEDRHDNARLIPAGTPLFRATLKTPDTWIANRDAPYIAFCGLGRPEKFQRSLNENGINIASWHPYPDHYNFTVADLHFLAEKARAVDGRMITTAKDAARIPRELARELPLDIMPVEVLWNDKEAVTSFLQIALERR